MKSITLYPCTYIPVCVYTLPSTRVPCTLLAAHPNDTLNTLTHEGPNHGFQCLDLGTYCRPHLGTFVHGRLLSGSVFAGERSVGPAIGGEIIPRVAMHDRMLYYWSLSRSYAAPIGSSFRGFSALVRPNLGFNEPTVHART